MGINFFRANYFNYKILQTPWKNYFPGNPPPLDLPCPALDRGIHPHAVHDPLLTNRSGHRTPRKSRYHDQDHATEQTESSPNVDVTRRVQQRYHVQGLEERHPNSDHENVEPLPVGNGRYSNYDLNDAIMDDESQSSDIEPLPLPNGQDDIDDNNSDRSSDVDEPEENVELSQDSLQVRGTKYVYI